jgi:hypothetical protein
MRLTAHAMQSMAIKGFIVHDRESGTYALTDSGRAALLAIPRGCGADIDRAARRSNPTSRRARPRCGVRE